MKTLTSESISGDLSNWRINSAISGMLDEGARTMIAFAPASAVTTAPARIPESTTRLPSASTATIDKLADSGVRLSFVSSPSPLIAVCNTGANSSAIALFSGKTLISLLAACLVQHPIR